MLTGDATRAQVLKEIKKSNGTLSFSAFVNVLYPAQVGHQNKSFDDSDLIKTPAQKIIAMLKEIKHTYVK
jgi:hypothetical protein